jgi:hypothetical protein
MPPAGVRIALPEIITKIAARAGLKWARPDPGADAHFVAAFTFETSQSMTVLSRLPEASMRPSDAKATDSTLLA